MPDYYHPLALVLLVIITIFVLLIAHHVGVI